MTAVLTIVSFKNKQYDMLYEYHRTSNYFYDERILIDT